MALRGGRSETTRSRADTQRALDEFDELAGLRGEEAGGAGAAAGAGAGGAYSVEHLATFTVTRETGIVFPADGMRRLLQLEKTNGIWSQKMQLCVDGQWVLVMDYETGAVMERFPGAWLHSPTAFTSPEPAELYNNVVAFVVGPPASPGAPAAPAGEPPRRELHIFQCHDVAAHTLVEELNALRGGAGAEADGRDFIIERERERERERDRERERERDSDMDRPRRQQMSAQLRGSGGGAGATSATERDDASSSGSERFYEQDIAILNRCFDDIEKFIARLQHAAAASRELERRRRSRGGVRRGPATGDGMLSLRTRPPPPRDFVDVLQKFKLSFNLLARLRAHIHDPNAPELVHFLFTPLALIVDAAQDAADEGGALPQRVVQPLLTRDALNLLANCVTSKETELWHSLGDAWLVPREQWKTSIPPYQPVFMDGWSPHYQVDEQPLRRSSTRGVGGVGGGAAADPDEPDVYAEQFAPYSRSGGPVGAAMAHREDSAASSPEREPARYDLEHDDELAVGGEEWARALAARGARLVRVTYPRTANNDKELSVVRGEWLVLLDDSRKWWRVRNRRGAEGHVPHTIVTHAASPAPHHRHQEPGRADSGASSPAPAAAPAPAPAVSPPPPPPPPPPPAASPAHTLRTSKSSGEGGDGGSSAQGDMQQELKAVLTLYQQRRNHLDIKKTPDIYIHQSSSPEEVSRWLEAKGFSGADGALRLSGRELFALTKAQLAAALGRDEGRRLYSQLLVQRNVSGYKTTSSSELQSILRKLREKVEVS